MEEEYRDIKGYEGKYQVSNLGNVKSLNYNNTKESVLLKPRLHKKYLSLFLCKGGKQRFYNIHQLVAIGFLGHKPDGYNVVVDHIDNNPLNNNVNNLQLTTNRHNSTKDKVGGTSDYIGVCWVKGRGKWQANITTKNKITYLGQFNTEIEAAEAYNKALEKITNGETN